MTNRGGLELRLPKAAIGSIAEDGPIMLWVSDPRGARVFVNRAWISFRGSTLTDELGEGWLKGVHDSDRSRVRASYVEAVRGRQPLALEYRLQHADGHYRWISDHALPWSARDGTPLGHVGAPVDVTDHKSRGTNESEAQLRRLAGRLNTAREEERAQLARELHDELGQTLTALKLDISRTVAALIAARMTPAIVDRVQSLVGLSDIALVSVKRIATALRPPALDHLGLAEAMTWEAAAFKARTGVRCQVRAARRHTALTAEQQTALFRIFQESLTNVVRHAHASAVQVTLNEDDDQAELKIRDNGRGISEAEAADPRAIGLVGMRERASLVGGSFKVSGRRGKGTVVSVRVPLLPSRGHASGPRARQTRQSSR